MFSVSWTNKNLSKPAFRRVGYAVLTVMFVVSEFAGWPPSLAPQVKEARAIIQFAAEQSLAFLDGINAIWLRIV